MDLNKEKFNAYDLVEIVKILRSPGGCPWDKEQTHESIRKDFIEEVYEAIEAIDEKSPEHLREELGDVLLQVVFHCVLETEKGSFNFDDVADEVCRKMIIRHPHVFGDISVDNTDQVLKNWDAIKMQTKSQKTSGQAMDSVSKALPSLMRAEKLIKKAKRNGISFDDREELCDEIISRAERLKSLNDPADAEKEIGSVLFSVVKLSGQMKTDCERSLYDTCDKFISDFKEYEKAASESGINIQDSDTEVTNQLWKEISKSHKLEEN